MKLCAFPSDALKQARLLMRLDTELLQHVSNVVVTFSELECLELKAAVAEQVCMLLELAAEVPVHSPRTQRGLVVRRLMQQCCQDIRQIISQERVRLLS